MSRTDHRWIWTVAVAALACAPRGASIPQGQPPAAVPAAVARAALLQPGDVVRLRIWREPDLSGDFQIDETGVAVFPKLGPVQVSDLTPGVLKQRLVEAYDRYLRNPAIDVVPLRRVNILGAVRSPGLYPVDATLTVADALALAGGTTAEGDPDRVQLVRRGQRVPVRLAGRSGIAESAILSGDQLYVRERSWVSRNGAVVAAVITGLVSLLIAFETR